jgi:endonuclease YncB( thermonuclease family)
VADVQCKGKDVGKAQVAAGMAWVFDRYAEGYEDLYPLQDHARASRVGLWSDTAPTAPWDWRRHK